MASTEDFFVIDSGVDVNAPGTTKEVTERRVVKKLTMVHTLSCIVLLPLRP